MIASEDASRISTLAVRVNAGSRYATKDGVSHLLSRFNYQDTNDKSALRLVRESELLSGRLESQVCRNYITLKATFLKEHLPYYVNSLANVLYKTSFKKHELVESVLPAANYDLARYEQNPINVAKDLLYNVTFRSGLGNPLLYDGVESVSLEDIQNFADDVYTKENIDIIAKGVNTQDLSKFINDSLFNSLPMGTSKLLGTKQKTYQGEDRVRYIGSSVVSLGIPFNKEAAPQFYALSKYLTSSLSELSPLIHSSSAAVSGENGLFVLNLLDADASVVTENIKKVVQGLRKGINLSKAKDYAKLELELENQLSLVPRDLSFDAVKDFKLEKFNLAAVGDVSKLPFADEL